MYFNCLYRYGRSRVQCCEPGLCFAGGRLELFELAAQPARHIDQDFQFAIEVVRVDQETQLLAKLCYLAHHSLVRIGTSLAGGNHLLINLAQPAVPGNIDCVALEIAAVEYPVLAEQKQVGPQSLPKRPAAC